jgi:O-antigen ligase
VLTLLYVAITLLSPGVFGVWIIPLHIELILGGVLILLTLPKLGSSGMFSMPDGLLGVGLVICSCASMLATGYLGGVPKTFFDLLPIVSVFYFIAVHCNTPSRVRILVAVMTLVALFILAQAFRAEHFGDLTSPYVLRGKTVNGELDRIRGLGVINDPNDLGQFLVMLIPLLWLRWKKGAGPSNLLLTVLPALLMVGGMYLTHSRGGTLALIAVLLFGFKDKLGYVLSSVMAAGGAALALALGISGGRGMNDDDGGRVSLWSEGLRAFRAHPLLGIGPNNFVNYTDNGLTAHNSFVLAMTELGLLGYFFWLGLIVSAWFGLWILVKARNEKKKAAQAEAPGTVGKMPFQMRPNAEPMWKLTAAPAMRAAGATVAPAYMRPAGVGAAEPMVQRVRPRFPGDVSGEPEPMGVDEAGGLAYSVLTSMVGLLVAALFLSRTYAVSLYIVLGIAFAVRGFVEPRAGLAIRPLSKRVLIACGASIVLLYLFIRFHGLRR